MEIEARCGADALDDHVPASAHGAAVREGFNLHASVRIDEGDDVGRERLARYGARPPFSLERFKKLPGGRIGYRVKKARGGGAKMFVLTPLELLARLSALIPPPRYPLVRYQVFLRPGVHGAKRLCPGRALHRSTALMSVPFQPP
jgi:hypothetical protein